MTRSLNKTVRFRFQGNIRHDLKYDVWIGRCLETGHLVTADTREMVQEMLLEILDDETMFALDTGNIRNLYSSAAEIEEWRFFADGLPETVTRENYEINLVSSAK